jgi:hypothetical protein
MMMKQAENKMTNPEAKRTNASADFGATRRPYVKPAFEFEQVFEITALSCGGTKASFTACRDRFRSNS